MRRIIVAGGGKPAERTWRKSIVSSVDVLAPVYSAGAALGDPSFSALRGRLGQAHPGSGSSTRSSGRGEPQSAGALASRSSLPRLHLRVFHRYRRQSWDGRGSWEPGCSRVRRVRIRSWSSNAEKLESCTAKLGSCERGMSQNDQPLELIMAPFELDGVGSPPRFDWHANQRRSDPWDLGFGPTNKSRSNRQSLPLSILGHK